MLIRIVFICLIGVSVVAPLSAQPCRPLSAMPADFPAFRRHVIDDNFSSGYQNTVADVNGDGRLDILALSTTPARLNWYRNPDWTRFVLTTETNRNIDLAPYDIDGDGDLDLALASEFALQESTSGGLVQWLEQPADPTQTWTLHPIDAVPTSHRIRWADLDGDGCMELLNLPILGVGAQPPEYDVGLTFKAYRIPLNPAKDDWQALVLDSTLKMAHGIAVVRWNNDLRDDVLTASFAGIDLFLMRGPGITWTKHHIGVGNAGARPKQGSSEVGLGHLGNQPFVASIEPWHGNEVVVYMPDDPEKLPWHRTVIDDSFDDGHALRCADLDGDTRDEIVAGHRGPGFNLYIYRYRPDERIWERLPLDAGGMSTAGVTIADISGDGRPDILATGSRTGNVVWYENLGPASKSDK